MIEPMYSERRRRGRAPTVAEKCVMGVARDECLARNREIAHAIVAANPAPATDPLEDIEVEGIMEALRLFPGVATVRAFSDAFTNHALGLFAPPRRRAPHTFRLQAIDSLALTTLHKRTRLARGARGSLAMAKVYPPERPVPDEPEGGWQVRVIAPMPDGFTWEHGFTAAGAS